jgi:hypothetical protein
MFQRSLASTLIASLFFAGSLAAQKLAPPSLTVTESVLTSGGVATICYRNASLANQAIVIDVDNGMRRNPINGVIEIHLDANGVGKATWSVPNWLGANFNAPGVTEVHRVIV